MKVKTLTSQAATKNTRLLIHDFFDLLRMASMLSSIHVVKMKRYLEAEVHQNLNPSYDVGRFRYFEGRNDGEHANFAIVSAIDQRVTCHRKRKVLSSFGWYVTIHCFCRQSILGLDRRRPRVLPNPERFTEPNKQIEYQHKPCKQIRREKEIWVPRWRVTGLGNVLPQKTFSDPPDENSSLLRNIRMTEVKDGAEYNSARCDSHSIEGEISEVLVRDGVGGIGVD